MDFERKVWDVAPSQANSCPKLSAKARLDRNVISQSSACSVCGQRAFGLTGGPSTSLCFSFHWVFSILPPEVRH